MGHERDFLTVGSMGHASSIALGIALHKPRRQVGCNRDIRYIVYSKEGNILNTFISYLFV
jgi:hypothetical protein